MLLHRSCYTAEADQSPPARLFQGHTLTEFSLDRSFQLRGGFRLQTGIERGAAKQGQDPIQGPADRIPHFGAPAEGNASIRPIRSVRLRQKAVSRANRFRAWRV